MIASKNLVRVEFYGIPRLRAGVAEADFEIVDTGIAFTDLLVKIGSRFDVFKRECLETLDDSSETRLQKSLTANIDGQRFIHDASTMIHQGETVLILSSDAGG